MEFKGKPSLDDLARDIRAFVAERDWEQFHSPKNLSMALAIECAELMEHFQWLTEAESRSLNEAVKAKASAELADVLIYLVRLSQVLDIDLLGAAREKLRANALKYPVEKAKGNAKKYTELDE